MNEELKAKRIARITARIAKATTAGNTKMVTILTNRKSKIESL